MAYSGLCIIRKKWLLVFLSLFLVSCKSEANIRFINNTDIPHTMYVNGDARSVYARSVAQYEPVDIDKPNLSFHVHNITPQLQAGKYYSLLGKYNEQLGKFEVVLVEDKIGENASDDYILVYNLSDEELNVAVGSGSEIVSFVVGVRSMQGKKSTSDDVRISTKAKGSIRVETPKGSIVHEAARVVVYDGREAFFVYKNHK